MFPPQIPTRNDLPRRTTLVLIGFFAVAMFAACNRSAPQPPKPVADMQIAPGLRVFVEVTDRLRWSAADVRAGGGTKPLAEGCFLPGVSKVTLAKPEGTDLRLRIAPTLMPDRGEEPTWMRQAPEACKELTGAPCEFLYTGGDHELVLRIENGKYVLHPRDKPAG